MYEAPTIAVSREGQVYAALPLHVERLIFCFEPMTPNSPWSNLVMAPRPALFLSTKGNIQI